jgi:hypothetical protein
MAALSRHVAEKKQRAQTNRPVAAKKQRAQTNRPAAKKPAARAKPKRKR